jgi:GH24 family phage-related lysozyme (muramidase)
LRYQLRHTQKATHTFNIDQENTEMTTPNTATYRTALKDMLVRSEGIRQNIYIDSSGYLTTGMGLLLIDPSDKPKSAAFASTRAVINTSEKPLFDRIQSALTAAGNKRTDLEKQFVIENIGGVPTLVRFKDGSIETDKSKWTDIRTLIPTKDAVLTASQEIIGKKETAVDKWLDTANKQKDANGNTLAPITLTESQRVALVSRFYNGFIERGGQDKLTDAIRANDPVEIFKAFTTSREANGSISRSVDEFKTFMGSDKVHPISAMDNSVGYTFVDKDGRDVVIGYDTNPKTGNARSIFAYRYLPVTEGEPQRFEYFDPRSLNSISQKMPLRISDKVSVSGMDEDTRLAMIDQKVDDVVAASGLTGEAATQAADKLRSQLAKYKDELATTDDVGLAIDAGALYIYSANSELTVSIDGQSSLILTTENNGIFRQVVTKTGLFGGDLQVTYEGPDADSLVAISATRDSQALSADFVDTLNTNGISATSIQSGDMATQTAVMIALASYVPFENGDASYIFASGEGFTLDRVSQDEFILNKTIGNRQVVLKGKLDIARNADGEVNLDDIYFDEMISVDGQAPINNYVINSALRDADINGLNLVEGNSAGKITQLITAGDATDADGWAAPTVAKYAHPL